MAQCSATMSGRQGLFFESVDRRHLKRYLACRCSQYSFGKSCVSLTLWGKTVFLLNELVLGLVTHRVL